MRTRLKELIYVALLTSLVCVSTMVIKIPSPLNGYVNLGDCMVLIAGWCLFPAYGFLSAGLGSALADLFSGYALYAPATFLIKGLMALVAFGTYKLLHKKIGKLLSQIIGGVLAEVLMILGYFLFEGFLDSMLGILELLVGLFEALFGEVLEKFETAWIEIAETGFLDFDTDMTHLEAVGERSEDFERFAGDFLLLVWWEGGKGS